MAKITFYRTSGVQVDPNITNPTDLPEPIEGLIDHEIEFYIDFDRLLIASIIWARSSAAGNRRVDSFYVVYQGDNHTQLFENFVTTLNNIESGDISTDHSWEFPHDNGKRYELPWTAESYLDYTLTDIGLKHAEQLALQELVEEGETLDVGMVDWEVAIVPAVYLLKRSNSKSDLAISKRGRQSVITDVGMVIQPEKDANFLPLTASTSSKFEYKKDNLKETITNESEAIFRNRLAELTKQPIEDRERDLIAIKEKFSGTGTKQFRTDIAEKIIDVITSVSEGRIVADKYDTNVLESDEKSSLVGEFETIVEKEIQELKQKTIVDEYTERLKSIIDRSTTEPLENRHNIVNKVISLLNGDHVSSGNDIVQEFQTVYDDMEDSELLQRNQRKAIENNAIDHARNIKTEIENIRRDDIESKFEAARQDIETLPLENQKRVILAIKKELSTIPSESKPKKLPDKYKEAIDQLQSNEILDNNIIDNIESNELADIRELESSVDEKLYQQRYKHIKRRIGGKIRIIETHEKQIHFLLGVKKLLKGTIQRNPIPDEIDSSLERKLQSIQEELTDTSESTIYSEFYQDICDDLSDYCDEELEDIRETEIDKLQERTINDLTSNVAHLNHEKKIRRVRNLKSELKQIQSKGFNEISNIRPLQDKLPDLKTPIQGKYTLNKQTLLDYYNNTIGELESIEAGYQNEYKEHIDHKYSENITKITNSNEISEKEKLYRLKTLQAILEGRGKESVSREDYGLESGPSGAQINIEGVKFAVSKVNPNSNSNLNDSYKTDLANKFLEDINSKIDNIYEEKKADLIASIENEIQSNVLPQKPYDDISLDTLTSAKSQLETFKAGFNEERINLIHLRDKEWFDISPNNKKEQIHRTVRAQIDEWDKELIAAIDREAIDIYQRKLKKIQDYSDSLDKIVALKEFQNLLKEDREEWPSLITSETSISAQTIEVTQDVSELQQAADEELTRLTDEYIDEKMEELDETLSSWEESGNLSYTELEELEQRIEDPEYHVEGDIVAYKDQVDTIHFELSKFGHEDDTYKEIRESLLPVSKRYKEKFAEESSDDDGGYIGTIKNRLFESKGGATTLGESVDIKASHIALMLLLGILLVSLVAGGLIGAFL